MAPTVAVLRKIKQVVQGEKQEVGAGVTICRTVGTSTLKTLDPYVMLDELRLPAHKAAAGFPDHPHRGFEACTIMISGKLEHTDSAGHRGIIGPGGAQWMIAGRGIIHSEMPAVTTGDLWVYQLWVNLPAKDKMVKPRYQDYRADEIPIVKNDRFFLKVFAGESHGVRGPIEMRNPGMVLDVQLQPGASFDQYVPENWSAFVYVSDGEGLVSGSRASKQQTLVLGSGNHMTVTAAPDHCLRFLVVAGQPIGEKIVRHGPFVMNTQEEINQAFEDYQTGRLQNPESSI